MEDNELIVRFHDQSESYVFGFEAGEIHEAVKKKETIERLIHTQNSPTIIAIFEQYSYEYSIVKIDETWSELKCSHLIW